MKYAILLASMLVGLQFAAAVEKPKAQVITLQVTEKGFEPGTLSVSPGTPVILQVRRKTDDTCAKAIKISSRKIKKDLPLNKVVSIDLGTLEKGSITFACGMDMMTGHLIVQ